MTKPSVATLPRTDVKPRVQQPRLWNVVLLDDEDHSYEYVIELAQRLFGHPKERGYQIAKKVDNDGRAVLLTTHREHAELKVEQIHSFGRDTLIASSKGAMSALLEPADFDADNNDD